MGVFLTGVLQLRTAGVSTPEPQQLSFLGRPPQTPLTPVSPGTR